MNRPNEVSIFGVPVSQFRYERAPGLYVVTAHYNPAGYEMRRRNHRVFAKLLRDSGIPLLTVENAFDDQPFDLSPSEFDVVQVRGGSKIWQKERLLNLAISWLPSSCTAVAWLDADLVFRNPNWARDTVELLKRAPIAQVFKTCHCLPEDFTPAAAAGEGEIHPSFTDVVGQDRSVLDAADFHKHGHTGYGWAARRDLLETHGLYECAIAGSADHFMAHAACGDHNSECVRRMLYGTDALIEHFNDWAEPFAAAVRGRLATAPGEVCHLWHGANGDRRYLARHIELAKLGYNPALDIVAPTGQPLELASGPRKALLERWFNAYFEGRKEDGARRVA